MNILLIDNGTSYLSKLLQLLSNHSYQIVKYFNINTVNFDHFDATILSGGHGFSVMQNEGRFSKEVDFIRNSTKPILGICFGFELISYTFGATLKRLKVREKGILDINIVTQDKIFSNINEFQVFENHRWVVTEAGSNLKVLARSKDGIEVIKHVSKQIYGVQFHPEMFVDITFGDELFNIFLEQIKLN